MAEAPAQETEIIERRLGDLIRAPREDLDKEIKSWLDLNDNGDKARLAKAILALANHGGGYVIIGFAEQGGTWTPADPRPEDLAGFSQDAVNGIVSRFAEPVFHCEMHHVPHPETGEIYPVIFVPGGHSVPIRSKRPDPTQTIVQINQFYIRRPGPASEPPQTGREWDELIRRCVRAQRDEMLDAIRGILAAGEVPPRPEEDPEGGAVGEWDHLEAWIEESLVRWHAEVDRRGFTGQPASCPRGYWIAAYRIVGIFPRPDIANLRQVLKDIEGRETGWPPWLSLSSDGREPFPMNGIVEAMLATSQDQAPSTADFWRVSPEGATFLLRGYQEDSNELRDLEPGIGLDLILPVWRIAECLLHADRLTAALGCEDGDLEFYVRWMGLEGRCLGGWATPERVMIRERYLCRQNEVVSRIRMPIVTLSANLLENVKVLTLPLFQAFSFFQPPDEMFTGEIERMRGSRVR